MERNANEHNNGNEATGCERWKQKNSEEESKLTNARYYKTGKDSCEPYTQHAPCTFQIVHIIYGVRHAEKARLKPRLVKLDFLSAAFKESTNRRNLNYKTAYTGPTKTETHNTKYFSWIRGYRF